MPVALLAKSHFTPAPAVTQVANNNPQATPSAFDSGTDSGVKQCHFEALSKASGVASGLFLCT